MNIKIMQCFLCFFVLRFKARQKSYTEKRYRSINISFCGGKSKHGAANTSSALKKKSCGNLIDKQSVTRSNV